MYASAVLVARLYFHTSFDHLITLLCYDTPLHIAAGVTGKQNGISGVV